MNEEEAAGVSLKDYMRVLRRNITLIVSVVVIVTLLALLVTLKMEKQFEATAVLRIEAKRMTLGVSLEEFYWGAIKARDYFNTECRTMESRGIVRRVFEKLQRRLTALERYREASDPLSLLIEDIKVTPDIDSYLVKISYESPDPRLSADVVNGLIDEYLAFKRQSETGVTEEAQRRVLKTLQDLEEQLSESEKRLADFERKNRVGSFQKELERVSEEVSVYKSELTRLLLLQEEVAAKWRSFKDAGGDMEKLQGLPEVSSDALVRHYLKLLADLEQQRVALLKKYAPSSAEVKAIDAQKEQAEKSLEVAIGRIVESVSTKYERCREEIEQKKKLLAAAQEKERELLEKLNEYERLKAEVDTKRKLYNEALSRKSELESASYSTSRSVEVIDRAAVPVEPSSPNLSLNLAIAFLLSLLGGVGLVFLLEHLDDSIRDDVALKKAGGLEPVGTIPFIRVKKGKRKELMTVDAASSGAAEAFRAMMISIFTLLKGGGSKAILVTSSEPKEGKTLVCSNLAAAMARWGKKTLIIDTDLRHPSMHRIFDIDKEKGLCDYLTSDSGSLDGFVRSTGVERLSILPSGTLPHSPADMLGAKEFRQLLEELKKEFDVILFDSPPVLGMADSMILASYVDAVLMVVLVGKTTVGALNRAVEMLKTADTELIGAALNEVSPRRSRYYYYSYYYRYYRPYGERG